MVVWGLFVRLRLASFLPGGGAVIPGGNGGAVSERRETVRSGYQVELSCEIEGDLHLTGFSSFMMYRISENVFAKESLWTLSL